MTVNLGFLDRSRLLIHSSSSSVILMRLSGPRSRPTTSQKSGSTGNRTRDRWICSQGFWSLDHRCLTSVLNSIKVKLQIWYCPPIYCWTSPAEHSRFRVPSGPHAHISLSRDSWVVRPCLTDWAESGNFLLHLASHHYWFWVPQDSWPYLPDRLTLTDR
jgi:hypothetical protein